MWPRLILRELIPLLPRLLRLLPMLEGFFTAERSSDSASAAQATRDLVSDLQVQIAHLSAERRREALELQAKFDDMHQELRMLREHLEAIEQQVNAFAHQLRLIFIGCVVSGILGTISLALIAVVLSRISH